MTDTDHRPIGEHDISEVDEHGNADDGRRYRDKPEHLCTSSDRSEAYLDSRPVGGPYNPAGEYGDPDWREPESDDEAQARTDHLAAQPRDPKTQEWIERVAAIAEQDRDLVEASLALSRAEATHDPDEIAEATAEYQAELAAAEARDREPADRERVGGEPEALPDWLDGEFADPEHDEEEPEL